MVQLDQEEGRYRVLLLGVGENSEEEKKTFCENLSKNYGIPLPLLRKIVDRCPIILKKNLSQKKAAILGKALRAYGGLISIEERRKDLPISLEFQELVPHQLALESSNLHKTCSGVWSVIGRIKNISDEMLGDIWAMIQLFDALGEFIAFEEAPLPINPLPPEEGSPFKVVFEGDDSIKKISIAFKNVLGQPIPAVDKRKKREWVEVEQIEVADHFFSLSERSPGFVEGDEKIEFPEEDIPSPSEKLVVHLEKEEEGKDDLLEGISLTPSPLTLEEDSTERLVEPQEPDLKIPEGSFERNECHKMEESKDLLGVEIFQPPPMTISEELGKTDAEEKNITYSGLSPKEEKSEWNPSVLEEATQLLETISEKTFREEEQEETEKGIREVVQEESPSPFSWVEDFKISVETFYQRPPHIFSIWFKEAQQEGRFIDPFHALLTILVYSRFDQENQPVQALENTQRVFKIILQGDIPLDEVPALEGTTFVSTEEWKERFHRAIPKIHQIGNAILGKKRWEAFDLERLLQVIPQMGHQNSRLAVRLIHELMTEKVEIDFSNTPVVIEEALYRVASRLGIVDPLFDSFQGRHSKGDEKIQSFAKMVFSENPSKIEEPMTLMGMEQEQGGHCFPVQPACGGCRFETFCPRYYIHFDPLGKR